MNSQLSPTTFEDAAAASFHFLVADYGYSLHQKQDGAVEFLRDNLLLRISRDPGSYMIYVETRRIDTGELYVLHEILNALHPDEPLSPQCSGADSVKMARCLRQLSELCQRHLQELLTLDETAFEQVRASANEERRRYTLDAQYGPIKDRANLAWERKDWETARKLYDEAKPGLSETEKRRLDFLTNKIDPPSS